MEKMKGILKQCPGCGKPMSLMKAGFGHIATWAWVCWECPRLINYQSVEASELKEVEVN